MNYAACMGTHEATVSVMGDNIKKHYLLNILFVLFLHLCKNITSGTFNKVIKHKIQGLVYIHYTVSTGATLPYKKLSNLCFKNLKWSLQNLKS